MESADWLGGATSKSGKCSSRMTHSFKIAHHSSSERHYRSPLHLDNATLIAGVRLDRLGVVPLIPQASPLV